VGTAVVHGLFGWWSGAAHDCVWRGRQINTTVSWLSGQSFIAEQVRVAELD
jgi:hypothetical protein